MSRENLSPPDPNKRLHEICQGVGYLNTTDALKKLFADHGGEIDINRNINGNTALTIASQHQNKAVVEFLLNKGADINLPDEKGNTPLIIASQNHVFEMDVCKVLLSRGADTNIQNKKGNTALMSFVRKQEVEIIGSLPNSSVNLQNEEGDTALIAACRNLGAVFLKKFRGIPTAEAVNQDMVSNQIIKLLLEKGADPSIKNQREQNSLMSLSGRSFYNAAQLAEIAVKNRLIKGEMIEIEGSVGVKSRYFVADKEAESSYRDKAREDLAIGTSRKVKDAVELLVLHGAQINERDNSGKTALEIAGDERDEILFKELLKAGANEYDLKRKQGRYRYLTNQDDHTNISCESGDGWHMFADFIAKSVVNKTRDIAQYPRVKLNEDNSISFFFEDVIRINGFTESSLKEFLSQEYVVEQFKFHAQEYGFSAIGGGDILQATPHEFEDMTEYKFNLSPENFDTIMKLNPSYVGYRNDGSILKLNRNFTLKDGAIMLFPGFRVNDEMFEVRATGCQFFEMPTLQLMRLLPNYENEILPIHRKDGFRFHWVPQEVEKSLCFGRQDFVSVLNQVFTQNGLRVTEGSRDFTEMPDLLTVIDPKKQSTISVVAMDNDSKDFYALYGNCSVEELESCESVEVKTTAFLQAVSDHLNKKSPGEKYQTQEEIDSAKQVIEEMLAKAKAQEIEKRNVTSPNSSPRYPEVDVERGRAGTPNESGEIKSRRFGLLNKTNDHRCRLS